MMVMNASFRRRPLRAATACVAIAALLAGTAVVSPASAFCGFYVAKADAKLFNRASKVVLARDEGRTAVTMANDYEGDPKEFAVVIPVPTFIERKQIGIVDMPTIERLDAFTAPRLVEYRDEDPCAPRLYEVAQMAMAPRPAAPSADAVRRAKGVTVEARYDVGEYDIVILSAEESDGLVEWLTDNGYRIPAGAEAVLGSYIKQKMRFFVAKVNLERMELMGGRFLRPLQVRYETKKFMLPLRLGTVNANGPQDLVVYAITRKGRVETTNYRTMKLPTGMDVPLFIKDEFSAFYKALFDRAALREDMRAVFLEHAWNMGWCDPCAADPLRPDELIALGARWLDPEEGRPSTVAGRRGPIEAFVTRLHVRYDRARFPEDLAFIETRDTENFQGRYVLRHPWRGEAKCEAGERYRQTLPARFEMEAATLADLTGWPIASIREKMETNGQSFAAAAEGGLFDRIRRFLQSQPAYPERGAR